MSHGSDLPLILSAAETADAWYVTISSYSHLAETRWPGNSEVEADADLGAVDTLFVDIDESAPGSIDEGSGVIHFAGDASRESYGILDEIARHVYLLNGGLLSECSMPSSYELTKGVRTP